MTTRVAVATARYGDPWDELSVLAARLAGALACSADVDVLTPVLPTNARSSAVNVDWDGACRLMRFPASVVDRRLRTAWRAVAFGVAEVDRPGACACPAVALRARPLPALVEEQIVRAEGGDAPALYDHLRATSYDALVFVGLHTPVACFGLRALPEGRRAFLVPGPYDVAQDLGIHDMSLARAERILVCTDRERRRMVERAGRGRADRVENVGFLLGINSVVRPGSPADGEDPFVVVARDWRTSASLGRYRPWAERLARRLPDGVSLRLVGPGAALMPHGVPHTDGRIDTWWWMSRSVAVIDPAPHRVIGQEVLEAMLLGVPVAVAANGDATREHAEVGNGGLWFRIDDELLASVRLLLQTKVAAALGEQGCSYATSRFVDSDTFVKRVTEVVLG